MHLLAARTVTHLARERGKSERHIVQSLERQRQLETRPVPTYVKHVASMTAQKRQHTSHAQPYELASDDDEYQEGPDEASSEPEAEVCV